MDLLKTLNFGLRVSAALFLVATMLGVVGCGSTSPTAVPQTVAPPPSPIGVQTAPPGGPATVPVAQPTATTGAVAAVTGTPLPANPTATKFAVAAVSPTSRPAAPSGKVVYTVATGIEPKFHFVRVANADGTNSRQILDHAQWPAFSPDGTRVAYLGSPEGGSKGLYIANADGGNPVLVVNEAGVCCINWSRDGNWIVYAVSANPKPDPTPSQFPGGPISMVKVDGVYKTIVPLGVTGNGPSFSPDGKQVVYAGCLPNTTTCGLTIVPATGGSPRQITTDNGGNPDWSTRGIVYQVDSGGGHRQVAYIHPDGSGKKQLTSGKGNDAQPAWSRDGNFIFWRSDQNGTSWAIYLMHADGSSPRKIIDNAPPDQFLWGWESLGVAP